MSHSEQKILQYLNEAHAHEIALISVLQSQIAMATRGEYRTALENHLEQTRGHAARIQARLTELGQDSNPLQALVGFTETLWSQTLALTKLPFDLLRGSGGEERVLKNAKDAAATEALEIATYTALERLATKVGDSDTAKLAASIRDDEERMLERILGEISNLTDAVVAAAEGHGSYNLAETGAADAAREVAGEIRATARKPASQAKRVARQARQVSGVAQAEGQVRGAVASEADLPIARYHSMTAEEIISKLPELSLVQLATIESYERKHDDRANVLTRIRALRRDERETARS